MRAWVLAATAFSLCVSLLAAAPGQAQTPPPAPKRTPPPLPGFMPAFEITRIVRASGFDPLAPPLREGTTYVVRATDFRGILMRVVVDARSGAIRAVNRIVPGPGPYGHFGMVTPPYGVAPAYPPPDIAAPDVMPDEETTAAPALPAAATWRRRCRRPPSSRRTSACIRSAITATASGGACIAQSRRRCQIRCQARCQA